MKTVTLLAFNIIDGKNERQIQLLKKGTKIGLCFCCDKILLIIFKKYLGALILEIACLKLYIFC